MPRHLSRRRAAAACRRGVHRFGSPQPIPGGISRQTCSVCGTVSIDISRAEPPLEASTTAPPARLQ